MLKLLEQLILPFPQMMNALLAYFHQEIKVPVAHQAYQALKVPAAHPAYSVPPGPQEYKVSKVPVAHQVYQVYKVLAAHPG